MNKPSENILKEKLAHVEKFKNLSDNDKRIIKEISTKKIQDITDIRQYTTILDSIITKETNNEMLHNGVHIEDNEPMYTHDELKTKEDLKKAKELITNINDAQVNSKKGYDEIKTAWDIGEAPVIATTNRGLYKAKYKAIFNKNPDGSPTYFAGGNDKLKESPYITYGGTASIIGGNILVNNCKCILIGIFILLVLYFMYIMVCECINSYKPKKYNYPYIL